jgi:hypothetical protein
VVQWVKAPNKCEALSSNPLRQKKKSKNHGAIHLKSHHSSWEKLTAWGNREEKESRSEITPTQEAGAQRRAGALQFTLDSRKANLAFCRTQANIANIHPS